MSVISVDQICVKSHSLHDSCKDEVIGNEDYGDRIKPDCLASSAMFIIACGIAKKMKAISGILLGE